MSAATTSQPTVAATTHLTKVALDELHHFAKLGRLNASLLHEIANPLTAALLSLEQTKLRPAGIEQVERNLQLLRRYVEAARQQVRQDSHSSWFSIRPQIEQLKRVIIPMAKSCTVQLTIDPIPSCRLFGDPVKFQHIVANLISNGIDAYQNDSSPDLARSVHVSFTKTRRELKVRVTDWGEGIDPVKLKLVFEPFYTTKTSSKQGLGIGLYLVRQYVTEDFGGSIAVASSRRHGTQFTLRVPLVE